MHNVHHLLSLMNAARNAITEDRYPRFVHDFFTTYYGGKQAPSWAIDALSMVGINLNQQLPNPDQITERS
jgi:queuine tRNA-ribosyltransferase catalytic subunit